MRRTTYGATHKVKIFESDSVKNFLEKNRKLPDDVIAEFKVISNQILEETAAKDELVNKRIEKYDKMGEWLVENE